MATTIQSERGVALIIVVSMLAVMSVLIAHMVVTTRISARESKVLTDRAKLRHAAEAAAEYGFWMHLCDRVRYAGDHRNMLTPTPAGGVRPVEEVWLADGRAHSVALGDDLHATVTVTDAHRGYSLEGKAPHRGIGNLFTDLEEAEELRAFLDRLADYADPDLATRLNGMEEADYCNINLPGFPRDAPLQFREEILWIPGVLKAFSLGAEGRKHGVLEMVQIIPPPGDSMPSDQKPSVFSASLSLIQRKLQLDAAETDRLEEALQRARKENIPLPELLGPGLIARLRRQFSVGESGVATIAATVTTPSGFQRTHSVVRDCRRAEGKAFREFRYINSWETRVE